MEPLSVGIHSVSNLGQLKSDQVSINHNHNNIHPLLSHGCRAIVESGLNLVLITEHHRLWRWTSRAVMYGSSESSWSKEGHRGGYPTGAIGLCKGVRCNRCLPTGECYVLFASLSVQQEGLGSSVWNRYRLTPAVRHFDLLDSR
jgi:hypothetical protein